MLSKQLISSFLLVFLTGICIYVSAQSSYRVNYSLPIVQTTLSDDTFYKTSVTYNIWENVLEGIIISARNGVITIYDNSDKPTTINKIVDNSRTIDTVLIIDNKTLKEEPQFVLSMTPADDLSYDIRGFGMREKWMIRDDGMIEKKINKLVFLHYTKADPLSILFWIYPEDLAKNHETATVEYSLDLSHFETQKDSAAFVAEIMSALLSGRASAYTPEQKGPLTVKEIEDAFKPQKWTDTITTMDRVKREKSARVKSVSTQNKICALRFRELWQIDDHGNFAKYVKEYRLMTADYDHTGEFRGLRAFLTIKNEKE